MYQVVQIFLCNLHQECLIHLSQLFYPLYPYSTSSARVTQVYFVVLDRYEDGICFFLLFFCRTDSEVDVRSVFFFFYPHFFSLAKRLVLLVISYCSLPVATIQRLYAHSPLSFLLPSQSLLTYGVMTPFVKGTWIDIGFFFQFLCAFAFTSFAFAFVFSRGSNYPFLTHPSTCGVLSTRCVGIYTSFNHFPSLCPFVEKEIHRVE